jgi:hypothetical protein
MPDESEVFDRLKIFLKAIPPVEFEMTFSN